MRAFAAIVLSFGASLLQPVLGDGYVISPSPRRVPPDVLEETKVYLPESVLQRLSLKQLRLVGENQIADSRRRHPHLGTLPCAGLPPDASNVHHVNAGDGVEIRWATIHRTVAKCTMTLMCHDDDKAGEITERAVLWRGRCGHRRGEMSEQVQIPSNMPATHFGQCWIQWRMETVNEDVFVQCIDVMVGSQTTSTTAPPSTTTSTESISTTPSPSESTGVLETTTVILTTVTEASTTQPEYTSTMAVTETEWTTPTPTELPTTVEETTTMIHFTTEDPYTDTTEITIGWTETTIVFETPTPTSSPGSGTCTSDQPSCTCTCPSPSTVYVTVTLIPTTTPTIAGSPITLSPTDSIATNGGTAKASMSNPAHVA